MLTLGAASAQDKRLISPGERIVFLGDSNTFAGGYVRAIELFLAVRRPEERYDILNLGLPSETVSGLSEPDHPYPRPCVVERLDRVLERTKPSVVVACYGMNDGIYYPFSEERFKRYREGINELIKRCSLAKARVILLTPPPFDARPVAKVALFEGAPKYSWMQPFKGYDETLKRYSEWLVKLKLPGVRVIDVHYALLKELARQKDRVFAGDGVHMDAAGHEVMAAAVLRGLGFKDASGGDLGAAEAEVRDLVVARSSMLGQAWLTSVGHKRPDTPMGINLAEAVAKAKELDGKIRAGVGRLVPPSSPAPPAR